MWSGAFIATLGVVMTTFEPNRELAFEFLSGFLKTTRTRYLVEPVQGDHTRLRRVVELSLAGRWRLI